MVRSQSNLAHDAGATAEKPSKYKLDELDADRVAKHLVLFHPTESVIKELMAKAGQAIPGLADPADVLRVMAYNPDCVFGVARKSKFNADAPSGEGFIAMLPLNDLGMRLLALDALNAGSPNVKFLAKPGERPVGIYWWAIFAPGSLAAGMALFMQKAASQLYSGLDIYARPVTEDGRHFLEVLGFHEGSDIGGGHLPHLWRFSRTPDVPLYDSYVPGASRKKVAITLARNFEDLSRVIAIRSAVYVGEQECPYDEEYDGNDLAATHLIAYIGDEPVGCMRVRFFADFAKIERLAIRKEFRKTRAAFQLVRAGLKLCQKKGYRRAYGHSQTRLVDFWGRFGFHAFEGGKSFMFSDFDYVELVTELEPDPDAVTIGTDPYVIIRPEGRWHRPGVLEKSSARAATSPSVRSKD